MRGLPPFFVRSGEQGKEVQTRIGSRRSDSRASATRGRRGQSPCLQAGISPPPVAAAFSRPSEASHRRPLFFVAMVVSGGGAYKTPTPQERRLSSRRHRRPAGVHQQERPPRLQRGRVQPPVPRRQELVHHADVPADHRVRRRRQPGDLPPAVTDPFPLRSRVQESGFSYPDSGGDKTVPPPTRSPHSTPSPTLIPIGADLWPLTGDGACKTPIQHAARGRRQECRRCRPSFTGSPESPEEWGKS